MPGQQGKSLCCLPGCDKPRWSRGRCGRHSQELKLADPAEWERIGELSKEQQDHLYYLTANNLPYPKWEFLGQEDILARRQRWLDEHPDAPTLMTWADVDDLIAAEAQDLK